METLVSAILGSAKPNSKIWRGGSKTVSHALQETRYFEAFPVKFEAKTTVTFKM